MTAPVLTSALSPESETFRVEEATATLADPVQGQIVDREELNARSYIDVNREATDIDPKLLAFCRTYATPVVAD